MSFTLSKFSSPYCFLCAKEVKMIQGNHIWQCGKHLRICFENRSQAANRIVLSFNGFRVHSGINSFIFTNLTKHYTVEDYWKIIHQNNVYDAEHISTTNELINFCESKIADQIFL